MAIIDSTIIMSLEEPENPVRAQNEADDAWAYSRESPWHCLDQMGYSSGTLEYFKLQVPDDHQKFHFRWYKNDNSRMSHRYWLSSNGEESVHWFFQAYAATLAKQHMTMKYAGGGIR